MENKWYIVNVVSGKDEKAKELLEFELKHTGLNQYVKEIVIPIERYKTVKDKKTVVKERNMLNGYMLINITKMHPEIVQTVNSTNYIIGFLGQNKNSKKNPVPITEAEAERILNRHRDVPVEIDFIVGESVKIIDGAFKSFKGTIHSIEKDKNKATIDVKIFGRSTKVEMELSNIQKEY